MKTVCIFTLYSEKGASSQYRAYIFKEELEKNFDVRWYNFWNDKYVTKYMYNKKKYFLQIVFQYINSSICRWWQINFIAPRVDIVFIQKNVIPKCNKTFLGKLKKNNVRIIFDIDDAMYTIKKNNSADIAKNSDVVICGNENLSEYYKKVNESCVVIPTIENTLKYVSHWDDTFSNKIIGWIGSQNTIHNFDVIINALNTVVEKHSEVKIAIISNSVNNYDKKIKNSYLIPWTKETYVEEMANFTIGIMPLINTEFNRGKCGFKLIQYLNMKKPVVASPVGVNKEIVYGNGILADKEEEWVDAIELLLYDKNEYYKYCKHIEKNFLNSYGFEINSKKLLELFEA